MTINNSANKVRKEDQINLELLQTYLAKEIDIFSKNDELSIKQFSGGASNLTYELSWGKQKAILRTPPNGANIKSAHDMGREFKTLMAIKDHFKYSPKPIHYCPDSQVIGKEFYLMEKVDGFIPRKEFPFEVNNKEAEKICQNLLDVHIKLHEIDSTKKEIASLGKPEGYISRQVFGWNKRYKAARIQSSLDAENLMTWLESNLPKDEIYSFIHNDYKLDNVVFDRQNHSKIISVLDWEMATLGSPLMDLGCSLAYWIEADDPKPMQMIRMMPTHLPGMLTRKEIVQYYLNKRNINAPDFEYFYIFGLFRLAVIVQQIYKRYDLGQTTNPAFAPFGDIAKLLITQAEKVIKKT